MPTRRWPVCWASRRAERVSGPADVLTLAAGTHLYAAPNPSTLTPQNAADMLAVNTDYLSGDACGLRRCSPE